MAITSDDYPLLIAAPMLQDYLVDKDTGFPLAGGIVTFYRDDARPILKNVYYQTGTPGNYTYIQLPNPMTLTSVGTIADNNGNDTIPFFFPYDEDDPDTVQTYFITVYSANSDGSPAVLQFTRSNFPFINGNQNIIVSNQDLINLIPNGQFAAHNNLPNNGLFPNGSSQFIVAQGGSAGWVFTKNNTSTDTDVITFNQILQEPSNLDGNPRFAIDIDCTASSGNDTFKYLTMTFNNVNRFASDSQFYTFSFAGISNTPNDITVAFRIIKYFGAGGSATQDVEIQEFNLESGQYNQFSTSFVFGDNSAQTIGTGNDDYVQLVLSIPPDEDLNLSLTNFILTPGVINFTDYPERPDNMVFANGIAGSMPTPDANGGDLYLPLILTKAGVDFDTSVIGSIVASISTATFLNKLLCDGSNYLTSAYSSSGIPYSRLQSVLFAAASNNIPLYGTGATFATANITDGISNSIRLATNQAGAQTGAADGSSATGFSFANIHTGQASVNTTYSNGNGTLLVLVNAVGTSTILNGTSGFTLSQLTDGGNAYNIFQVATIAASGIAPGSYFKFFAGATAFYVWFTINGAGADPAPGGTGFRVNLLSTYTANEVAVCVKEALQGSQVSTIICNAASTITAGSFWTFNANGTTYSVWYSKNGAGTAPVTGTPIKVSISGSDTADDVAEATQIAINSFYFAVPDFRGAYLQGYRGTGLFDNGANTRFSQVSNLFGNNTGTFQQQMFPNLIAFSLVPLSQSLNAYVNWYIHY